MMLLVKICKDVENYDFYMNFMRCCKSQCHTIPWMKMVLSG